MPIEKMFSFVKYKILKKGEHCGLHSGEVGEHAWQDKRNNYDVYKPKR
jgi:hypothetical protein